MPVGEARIMLDDIREEGVGAEEGEGGTGK